MTVNLAHFYAGEHVVSHVTPQTEKFGFLRNVINYDDSSQGAIDVNEFIQIGVLDWLAPPAHGTTGNDVIYLNGGNDFFADTYDFAPDKDSPTDHFDFQGGIDWIFGGAGSDMILAGVGTDHVYGEIGNDILVGGEGDDYIFGGDGEDQLGGDVGNDFLDGGAGNDVLGYARQEYSNVFGTGVLRLIIGPFDNGNDTMEGGDGNDTIYGGAGDDKLFGGPGDDKIYDGPGADKMWGDAGADTFFIKPSDDTLVIIKPNDVLSGGMAVNSIMDFEKSVALSDGNLITDKLVVDYSGFEAVVGTVNTTFKNASELSSKSEIDSYIGFLYDEQQHDLEYKTGADVIVLVHFDNQVDHLTLLGNADSKLEFATFG